MSTEETFKLAAEGYSEVSENIGQLRVAAPDGKQRLTDCANTDTGNFRDKFKAYEYRKSLIHECVTGQRLVATAGVTRARRDDMCARLTF